MFQHKNFSLYSLLKIVVMLQFSITSEFNNF